MSGVGTGAYGGYVAPDGNGGVVRPAPWSPARLAGWAWREAVLARSRGGKRAGLVAGTVRCRHHGRRPRTSGGGGDDGHHGAQRPWRAAAARDARRRPV